MAAYFTVFHEDGADDIEWHVGEPLPLIFHGLTEVQADCDELDFIKNIPHRLPEGSGKRVVTWKGASANTIYNAIAQVL